MYSKYEIANTSQEFQRRVLKCTQRVNVPPGIVIVESITFSVDGRARQEKVSVGRVHDAVNIRHRAS